MQKNIPMLSMDVREKGEGIIPVTAQSEIKEGFNLAVEELGDLCDLLQSVEVKLNLVGPEPDCVPYVRITMVSSGTDEFPPSTLSFHLYCHAGETAKCVFTELLLNFCIMVRRRCLHTKSYFEDLNVAVLELCTREDEPNRPHVYMGSGVKG